MAASPISVTVAFNRLPAVIDALRPNALAACQATGAATTAEARRRVHVISGRLRDSLRDTEGVMSNDVVTIVVYADAPYSFVEEQRRGGRAEGRPFSGSHAFLGPAAAQQKDAHTARVAAALIDAAGAKLEATMTLLAPSSTTDSTYEPDLVEAFLMQALLQNSIIADFTQRRIYNQLVPEQVKKPYCVIQFMEGADDLAGALRRLRSRLRYRITLVADGRSFQRLSIPAQQLDAALDARSEELPQAKVTSVRIGMWSYADKQLGREFVERGADYVVSVQRRSAPASAA